MDGPRANQERYFRDMLDPLSADKRNVVIPAYGLRKKVIPLDVALVELELKIRGDVIYADFNSSGVAEISLNSPAEDSFPLLALAGVRRMPYDGVYITAAAQPGLFVNLWYGYGAEFISPTSAIATIGSITNPIVGITNPVAVKGPRSLVGAPALADLPIITRDGAIVYGASYGSTALAGGASVTAIIAPAANVNGMIIWDATLYTKAATDNLGSYVCKATLPASHVDGDVILVACANAANYSGAGRLQNPVLVPAGKGLYHANTVVETGAIRQILYTLL